MLLEKRIKSFEKLGSFFSQLVSIENNKINLNLINANFLEAFNLQINRAHEFNGWFTKKNLLHAFRTWSNTLSEENLNKWTKIYNLNSSSQKTVALITAGNIPLVGFHDFLTVLISGHRVLVKQSSNDKYFLPLIAKFLEFTNPKFKEYITFTDDELSGFDAVIATGSNNTSLYFDYYFGKYPNIIRKNRNSVAILTGNETEDELSKLADDIFLYFGLGCRSVSKLFVPKNYDFDKLFKAVYKYKDLINYVKYQHNYDYNKTVYLMSNFKLLENGFLMLKEDSNYSSPIATLFYEYYEDLDQLKAKLNSGKESIQCIVSKLELHNSVQFGETQHPQLWNYADGVNTLEFLSSL